MDKPFSILAPDHDAGILAEMLARAGVPQRRCAGLGALVASLDESAGIIVAESLLTGDAMGDVLLWVEQQRPWSDLAFIVLAAKANAAPNTHHQVLDGLGNAVLLEWPLNEDTLASAVRVALRARRRQLALRDLTDTLETRVAERTALLAESEAQFRTMVETFPDGLFTLRRDDEGQFRFENFSPGAERRTGFTAAGVRGRTLGDVLPPAVVARVEACCRQCLAERATVSYTEAIAFPAGEGIFETTFSPMPVFAGRGDRVLGLNRDVTERNRLEERLRSAQKLEAVGQLTGGVAHDFNNLLQVILSGLALIERATDPARRTQVLDSIRRAAHRGGELTKRLLTIARKQELHPEPIDLAAWLADGAAELLSRMLRGDITVQLRVAEQLKPVEVDANQLELALINLAVNARDAMPVGGTLTLAADEVDVDWTTDPDDLSGRYVRLSVIDTGTGMSPAVQARVFEPFFTTKEIGKGTGLGLAQVYGFARQSRGGVRLRSTPGQGTTVSLLLPIAQHAPIPDAAEPARPDASATASAAILVCEDDDEVAALVVDMLAQLGHAPTRVGNAAAALGALGDERRVDLLFTDVMMPGGMDGLALARESARRRPGLPVLLTTGYTGEPGAEPLGLPMLRKPYALDDLARAVQHALIGPARNPPPRPAFEPRHPPA